MASSTKDTELCSFDVPETARHPSGHTIYKVVLQVTPKELTENSYQLVYWKRYNDIRKLYDALHRYHQAIYRPGKFPDFPEKSRFIERFDAAIVEERRIATKNFLNYALQHLYLRTHDAYLNFFQKGEKVLLPDVETATLQPEIVNTQPQTSTDIIPNPINESVIESKQDELLFTNDEKEQIEHVTNTCAQILEDLNDLQFEQQEQINKEKEEFDLIQEEVNEVAGLLVTGSKTSTHSYNYNTIVVVLLTEFVKFITAVTIYRQTHSFSQMKKEIVDNQRVLILYFIPSALYCLYNNLAFINLSSYDPTTYFLLLQFRVVVTGIIFQFLFNKRLTRLQWLSLFLLASGCIIKQFEHSSLSSSSSIKISNINSTLSRLNQQIISTKHHSLVNIHLIWILVQVFCSCFAGVYNEYLLKSDRTTQVDTMLQNSFMYINSIICNLILLIYFDYQQPTLSSIDKFFNTLNLILSGKQYLILLIIINNAAVGIVTSLFLKSMTSILKTFASALELLFTSILAWIFFNIPVSIYTFIAIFIVSTAVYLYSINPVVNLPKTTTTNVLTNSSIHINNDDMNSKKLNIGNEQERRLIV
ncbi:unnamed protein product [Rotaria sordida]|uniref:PX domain-containing protein n=1 Tax=Rotaria sordida TaxID=392033 RepID=A0A819B456_9BILA|nr:unnamed protein product [Rotaria sordida]